MVNNLSANSLQLCGRILVLLKTTAFYSTTNDQVQRYNKKPVFRLQLYTADNHKSWNIFLQPLTHVCNCQAHRSTVKTSFSLVLSLYSPWRATIDRPTVLPTGADIATNHVILRQNIQAQLATMRTKVSGKLANKQAHYNHYFNKKIRSLLAFTAGHMVYVNQPPFTTFLRTKTLLLEM